MDTSALTDNAEPYRDRKRYAWWLSIIVPALINGPLLIYLTGSTALAWGPVIFIYLIIPVLDFVLGEDRSNPPESAVSALEEDRYYRYITFATLPVLWAIFIASVWFLGTHHLPWYTQLPLILSAGLSGGLGINLGHELGHKNTKLERWLAKLVLAPTGYGHFFIEHNRGHHRDVATPTDPASSRMGESIYVFVLREMPGALARAWKIETERLQRCEQPVWSLHNEILQPALITLTLWTALILWLGISVLPFILLIAFWSNFQLTSANYIEHYGLLRQERSPGRYELCQPHHSWNSNHVFSNWVLFHLQRHSDHHAHPTRRYQSLRHFDNLPELPNGYMGMFLISYIPPLWYRIMDKRVIKSVGGDVSRIHFQPGHRAQLIARYGLTEVQS